MSCETGGLRPSGTTLANAVAVAQGAGSVPGIGKDRFLSPELAAAERFVASGTLRAVAPVAGDLK